MEFVSLFPNNHKVGKNVPGVQKSNIREKEVSYKN